MRRIPDFPAGAELIEDTHMAIVNAIEMVRTGVAFQGAIAGGTITPASFPQRVLIDAGEGRLIPIPTAFDDGQLDKTAHNLEIATVLVAVVATDSALDAHFRQQIPGSRRPLDAGDIRTISDLRGIEAVRALFYLIRNAFAHDPFNPQWDIRSANRIGRLVIDELGLTINTRELHGCHLDSEVWGGMVGLIELLRIAELATRPPGWDPTVLLPKQPIR